MNTLYLLLGSNIGNSKLHLQQAQRYIQKQIGITIRQSGIYQTAAWGNTNQADFLNQVIIVKTSLNADAVMETILSIEKKMGRVRTQKNAPRIIDIDILFFNKEIKQETHLTIPHPQLQNRRFVLVPLKELSPNLKHPVLKNTIHQLWMQCKDNLDVKKF